MSWVKVHGFDLLAGVGAGAVTIGFGMVYLPAGVIVGGFALLVLAIVGARAAASPTGRGES